MDKKKLKKITRESNILEVIQDNPAAIEIFAKYSLPCVGCAAANFESIKDIVTEFGIDEKELVKELNESLK